MCDVWIPPPLQFTEANARQLLAKLQLLNSWDALQQASTLVSIPQFQFTRTSQGEPVGDLGVFGDG